MVYEVLIASPNDVPRERDVLSQVIAAWNSANSRTSRLILQPLRWELDAVPASGAEPQSIITSQIVEQADILFAVFWSRIGTKTKKAASGTVAEIENFRARGKEVLVYFCNRAIPIEHDADQLKLLKAYKKKLASNTYYAEFSDLNELYEQASRHLATVTNKIGTGSGQASISSPEDQAEVGPRALISGTTGRLPHEFRLWLVVELENGRLYPQLRVRSDQGIWSHTVRIGVLPSEGSKGERFLVRLVSVGPVSDYEFQKYALGESGREDYLCVEWPHDTNILDSRTVVRGD